MRTLGQFKETSKLEVYSLDSLRVAVQEQINILEDRMKKETGYVIAGYGGETLYSYIGADLGYMGACLVPYYNDPVVYTSQYDADYLSSSMHYQNGGNERIHLRSMDVKQYFSLVIENLNKTLQAIDSLKV